LFELNLKRPISPLDNEFQRLGWSSPDPQTQTVSIVAVETPGVRAGRLLVLARQHAAGMGVKDVEGYVKLIETSGMLAPHVPCKKNKRCKRHVDLIETSHTLAPHVAVYVHGVELDVEQRARERARESERERGRKSRRLSPYTSIKVAIPILPTKP
jgi:hypothetical protein